MMIIVVFEPLIHLEYLIQHIGHLRLLDVDIILLLAERGLFRTQNINNRLLLLLFYIHRGRLVHGIVRRNL